MIRIGIILLVVFGFSDATCPDGWTRFHSSCYLFGHTAYTFLDAQRQCEHYKATLVNIESREEYNFIRGFLMMICDQLHWIGLTDETTEGTWKYYPSEKIAEFLNWYPGDREPNEGTRANCAAIYAGYNYQYADSPCTAQYQSICELADGGVDIVG
ncbi:hypothetical protein DPMN_186886 [Dreissena polymorpha]|uniref:C-type lectin domain-containing protein n=2 Tax=Dreissena polymorpha TaxID=45954 RepID=A0A9D4DPX4_DREPO|nr:hypothetical protein DPMN_186886 [Dreissena polymorpha]